MDCVRKYCRATDLQSGEALKQAMDLQMVLGGKWGASRGQICKGMSGALRGVEPRTRVWLHCVRRGDFVSKINQSDGPSAVK